MQLVSVLELKYLTNYYICIKNTEASIQSIIVLPIHVSAMMINLVIFYNLSGIAMCILSLLMFAVRKQEGEEGIRFNAAKYYLAVMFMLSGLSMFVAQFDRGLHQEHFEILNALMLLFFFLICQGFLLSFLILYASRYARKKIYNRIFLPVILLFLVYTTAYFFVGDKPVYSAREFMTRLPHEPLLMLRCVLLIAVISSVSWSIRLCHRAKREYHDLISNYFSETDFSRSIWLSNLLASGEALAFWILLTYFYTTTILELVVGIQMVVVFAFYVKEFYEYRKRYEHFRPALLLSVQENTESKIKDNTNTRLEEEDQGCAVLLSGWKARVDKPFTKQGLTISDVAKDLGIPKYRISNYVNRDKKNFCTWINNLRIGEATRLLREDTTLSISDIAEQTGFCDLPSFSRVFKKVNHMSPSEYRNKNK